MLSNRVHECPNPLHMVKCLGKQHRFKWISIHIFTTRIQPSCGAYIGLQYDYFGCNTDQLHLYMVIDKWLYLEWCNRFLHPFGCGVAIWLFCNEHKKLTQPGFGCKHKYCNQHNSCVSYYCNKTRGCIMTVLPWKNLSQNSFIATP